MSNYIQIRPYTFDTSSYFSDNHKYVTDDAILLDVTAISPIIKVLDHDELYSIKMATNETIVIDKATLDYILKEIGE